MSSSRLPKKVMLEVLGKPLLQLQIERIKYSRLIDQLVVATSNDESDNPLAKLCEKIGVSFYRGSLTDVLDRYYQAAKLYSPTHVVRLTGDCPIIDWTVIDHVIQTHIDGGYDYTSNTLFPSYPDGLDVEVMTFSALEKAWKNSTKHSEREHVTISIYNNKLENSLGNVQHKEDLSMLRWTVDEKEDFELVKAIYEHLYPENPQFLTKDVLEFLNNNPDYKTLNNKIARNEGLQKSILAEQEF